MNNKQRIILIIGSIILVIALITTPQYQIIDGNKFKANSIETLTNQYDLNNAMLRIVVVLAIFVPIYFVLKNKD